MAHTDIISALDVEIKRLQQARDLLTSLGSTAKLGASNANKPVYKSTKRRKRKMSAEARKRIADAQRKRWAKQKAQK